MSAPHLYQPNPQIEQLVARIEEMAVLPHVVNTVLELTENESALGDLERIIVVDPGFSTRLLAAANSDLSEPRGKVTSIRDAVSLLGFKQIKQIAMRMGFFDMFGGKNDRNSLRRRAWWRHSIDTAISCQWLASESGALPPGEAYTYGLLHYIGKPILDHLDPSGYERVEELVAKDGMYDLDAEVKVFGGHHVWVAMGACQKWQLPEPLVAALDYRSDTADDGLNPVGAACTALGSAIAHAAVEGPGTQPLPVRTFAHFGFASEQADDLLDRAISVIASARSSHA